MIEKPLTEKEIALATGYALRWYQAFGGRKNLADAIPVPVGNLRLVCATLLQLQQKDKPAVARVKPKEEPEQTPPLTETELQVFNAIEYFSAKKEKITTRAIAERIGLKSHNPVAVHIRTLIKYGYLKRVGPKQLVVLTGKMP